MDHHTILKKFTQVTENKSKLKDLSDAVYDEDERQCYELIMSLLRTDKSLIESQFDYRNNSDHDIHMALMPSSWIWSNAEYPEELAKMLVKSDAQESLTDYSNLFYSRNRKYSAGAKKVLLEDLLKRKGSTPIGTLKQQLEDYGPINGMSEWATSEPEVLKKVLAVAGIDKQMLSDSVYAHTPRDKKMFDFIYKL